jgi:hypothetical protein
VIEVPSCHLAGELNGEPADFDFDFAVRLIVDSYLELGEGTAIQPPDGEFIQLRNGLIVKFESPDIERMPQLNLGMTS